MTLADQIRAVEERRSMLTVYAPDRDEELLAGLAARNATVRYRRLPPGPSGFLTVADDDGFVASIGLERFEQSLASPVPEVDGDSDPVYGRVLEHLDDLVFSTLDRRRLLSATREIEDRAYRIGRGTLRVGFQSLSVFEEQVPVYETLAGGTDLGVHIYGRPDWTPPPIHDVTVHEESSDEVGRYWFLAFDGGGDDDAKCGLIAEEYAPDSYAGFWTYDPEVVDETLSYLEDRYG